MDGKIPPRHQIMETLDAALEESWQENSRTCQAKPAKYSFLWQHKKCLVWYPHQAFLVLPKKRV